MATLSKEELDEFAKLERVKVVFDVGTRTSIDYLEIRPNAEYHLFEPNPVYFEELKHLVGNRSNVYLNNYGLGDKEEELEYSKHLESFAGSEALPNREAGPLYPIKTLDWYVKEYLIYRIDFLKIDTEGMDYKVLLGGKEALKITKNVQYEYWDNKEQFADLLGGFTCKDIGQRNILCSLTS